MLVSIMPIFGGAPHPEGGRQPMSVRAQAVPSQPSSPSSV